MTRADLEDYLIDEAGYLMQELRDMTSHQLFEAYLEWNGICGYTDDIIDAIEGAYEIQIEEC